MIIKLPFSYIRDCGLKIAAQSVLMYYIFNTFLTPRFNLSTFSFAEVFFYCLLIFVLKHDIRHTLLIDSINRMGTGLQLCYSILISIIATPPPPAPDDKKIDN